MATPHPLAAAAGRAATGNRGIAEQNIDLTRVQLAPGRLIPGTRYVIRRWLGEGGMGVVYEAEHADVRRPVALKLLRPEYARDAESVALFRAEARTTSGIGSEHLVQMFDFVELRDGRLAIAMELLDGQELTPSLNAPMDPGRVVGILRQVCRGLSAAHQHGIVHRDIKPENVFLCRDGGRADRVKLLDFGIAVFVADDYTTRPLAGTPLYLSPEAIRAGKVGPAADVYAVGCMAWEMLTGKPAFEAPTLSDILTAHLELTPVPPSKVCVSAPPALDAAVMRALAKDPRDRFVSMADFEAALCEAQVAARLVTPWDDLPLPENIDPQRRDALLRSMPEPEAEPRAKRSTGWIFAAAGPLAAVIAAGTYLVIRPADPTPQVSPADPAVAAATEEARTAAARAVWVYPPAHDLRATTAYQAVRRLETLGSEGEARARELRREFSTTLSRLGDEYWEQVGGRPFARGYYEQALLFDPYAQPAAERATRSGEALSALEARAQSSSFTLDDLILAEPLMVLADSHSEGRDHKLSELREGHELKLAALDERVDALARLESPKKATARRKPANEPIVIDDDDTQPPAPDERPPPARNPRQSRTLAMQGAAALAAGETARAQTLFDRALTSNRRNATALAGMRDLYFDRGDYGRAVRYGKRAVAAAGRNAEHHLRLGDAYYKVSRFTEAQTEYAAAHRLGDARARWRLDKVRKKVRAR